MTTEIDMNHVLSIPNYVQVFDLDFEQKKKNLMYRIPMTRQKIEKNEKYEIVDKKNSIIENLFSG